MLQHKTEKATEKIETNRQNFEQEVSKLNEKNTGIIFNKLNYILFVFYSFYKIGIPQTKFLLVNMCLKVYLIIFLP